MLNELNQEKQVSDQHKGRFKIISNKWFLCLYQYETSLD